MTIWHQVGREIDELTATIRSIPVAASVVPETLRKDLTERFDFVRPIPLAVLTADLAHVLRHYAVQVTHPRYFGLFNPSVTDASVVADALVAAYNPQLATWTHAPGPNELERLTLERLACVLGFEPRTTWANFTTGGFEANLSAVTVALAQRFPTLESCGLIGLEARPKVYVTSETHHSFVKICRLVGLGTSSLQEVPTTRRFTMDVEALRTRVRADRDAGLKPFMIVGTIGTTGTGAIDAIPDLVDVAREFKMWVHVDAAWGGAAALVPQLRSAVCGVADADSVTWDAHKWLSVPMGAGMFFCRYPDAVRRAFSVSTSYMPAAMGSDTPDPYATTLQWSRRAIGLKLFMTLAERGLDGLAEQIDRQAKMGDALRRALSDAGWLIVNDTPLPLVCATHDDLRSGRYSVADLVRAVNERGRAWISDVLAGGERVVRACITSFRTDERDIEILVAELEHARKHASTGDQRLSGAL